ncbi:MAG TPA: Smr/MutS family protein [Vicinamibacteria bacterium]|nr:Smr/MutS family protein [Vicinamibacteria bacterium]
MPPSEDDPLFELPIDGTLDLHAFAPGDVASVVEEYLRECRARGILSVRVVHGRGKGVQRAVVRRALAALTFVVSSRDAPPESGGWGATLVRLRAPDHEREP